MGGKNHKAMRGKANPSNRKVKTAGRTNSHQMNVKAGGKANAIEKNLKVMSGKILHSSVKADAKASHKVPGFLGTGAAEASPFLEKELGAFAKEKKAKVER